MKYKFRKVDGVWQRREAEPGSKDHWKTLKVTTVVDHEKQRFVTRDGIAVMEPVHRNEWTWVRNR